MKEINIVWNKVTAHSRFWALVLFLGVLPLLAFYAGLKVETYKVEQDRLTGGSQQILFQSEHCMCRISDCTIQNLSNELTAPQTIEITSPKQGSHISPKSPIKVSWSVSPNFSSPQVSILLLDSNGRAASKPVIVPSRSGSATIQVPTKVTKDPYTILIQAASQPAGSNDVPFSYSGELYL